MTKKVVTIQVRSKLPSARNKSRAAVRKQFVQLQNRKRDAEQALATNPRSQSLKAKLFLINRELSNFQGDVDVSGL